MNAVGIDISKGKCMVAILRPFGEVVASPFEIQHTAHELRRLVERLKSLEGETRIVMEHTGNYYLPVAMHLHEAGLYVSVVNAILVHDYGQNSLRRVKTDKKDAVKIASYALSHWLDLPQYAPEEDVRHMLKTCARQCNQYVKQSVMLKNSLIALLDQTFPSVNMLFSSPPRKGDGHEKWIDFVGKFWHCECVNSLSKNVFTQRYQKWCKRTGYNFLSTKAAAIYNSACIQVSTLPRSTFAKQLITQAVSQLNSLSETLALIRQQILSLASGLPEFPVVMAMQGVGNVLGPQLMAEIGDVRRFNRKQSLVAFAGIDAPPFQSGAFEAQSTGISKRGSSSLRKTLFQVMDRLLKHAPSHDAVFQYLDKKRGEGKHYYVYMMAGANKFLRIYYARVKEHLGSLAVQ